MIKLLYTLSLFCVSTGLAFSQYLRQGDINATLQPDISLKELSAELEEYSAANFVNCHALDYPVSITTNDAEIIDGSLFWKISAEGMGIKAFTTLSQIPDGDTLFVLNKMGQTVEWVTLQNFRQPKWSTQVVNDELTLRYKSSGSITPDFEIRSYSLQAPIKDAHTTEDFGDSDFCEINVNCTEGLNYQDVKNSVVRILTKVGNAYFWCTGNLINNTAYDHRPFLLTAEHCAMNSSGSVFSDSSDIADWEFYFHYESYNCNNPATEGNLANNKITGAVMRARSDDDGGTTGSDFLLLELDLSFNNGIFPPSINPFFAGWNRMDAAPSSGVTIHHPEGDIKKISTSSKTANSGSYGSSVPNTHWEVEWTPTTNGHGVTEGGSSGGPYLNSNQEIVGTLTGGYATCTNNTSIDFYGKFYYHWDQNGNTPDRRLKDWLDPTNSGVVQLNGATLSDSAPPYDEDLIAVAPNPVRNGKLYINGLREIGDKVVYIFDAQGRQVYPKQEKNLNTELISNGYLSVDGLANGTYFIKIINKGDAQTLKFVKID